MSVKREKIMAKLTKASVKKLVEVANATKATGFMYATEAEVSQLVAEGLVEVNKTVQDPNDPTKFGVRATADGIEQSGIDDKGTASQNIADTQAAQDAAVEEKVNTMSETNTGTDTVVTGAAVDAHEKRVRKPVPAVDFSSIKMEENVPLPTVTRTGRTAAPEALPFAQMQPGMSFFLAATADVPEPSKVYGQVVSGATRKYAELETGAKAFMIRKVTENGQNGVRIFCVSPEDRPERKPRKPKAVQAGEPTAPVDNGTAA